MSGRGEILKRLLGVPEDASPLEILGVESPIERGVPRGEALREALARRRRQLAGHPAAGTREGAIALAAVEDAAARLGVVGAAVFLASDGEATSDRGETAVDAEVDLELLRAVRQGRGLGRRTLLQLRSIAQRRGVPPESLVERLRALRPDPRLRARPLGLGRGRDASGGAAPDAAAREVVALLDRLDRSLGSGPSEPDRGEDRGRVVLRTVGVSLLALGVVVAIALSMNRAGPDRSTDGMVEAVVAPDRSSPSAAPAPREEREASPEMRDAAPGSDRSEPRRAVPPPMVPAAWHLAAPRSPQGVPLGEGEGGEERRRRVERALREVDLVPARLLDLASRLRGEIGEPTPEQVGLWGELQRAAAASWPLRSEAQRRAVVAASVECLEAVDSWRGAVSLLEALGPMTPAAGGFDAAGWPIAWIGAWGAGLAGELAVRGMLAPPVRREVERQLQSIDLPRRIGFVGRTPLEETQARWLAAQAAAWALAPIERSGVEAWAWWFAAVDAIEPPALREAVLLDALRQAIRFWRSDRDGPASLRAALVANLTTRLDPLNAEAPALLRDALLGLIDSGEGVVAEAAAVLANALAALPGLGALAESPPLDAQSRPAERRRFVEAALPIWSEVESWRRTPVDAGLASRWRDLLAAVRDRPRRDDEALLASLLLASRLQEAAALVPQSPTEAEALLRSIEAGLLASPRERAASGDRPALATGRDGAWAERMTQALGDRARRGDLLRELRSREGGDLGPLDAAALLRTALGDGPEIRAIAAGVLLDRFAEGPEVLRQLSRRAMDAAPDAALRELLSSLCGESLPAADAPEFAIAARRALVGQRLRAARSTRQRLEALAGAYAASIEARARAAGGATAAADASAAAGIEDPAEAMAGLAAAWRARLLERGLAEDRRHLGEIESRRSLRLAQASRPPQRLVAEQAAVAEAWLAWERQRPAGGGASPEGIDALLDELSRRRRAASSSLEQALEQELAIASLWPRQWRVRGDREAME